MDFPEVMKEKRKRLHLTLGDVAKAIGYTVSYVSDVERRRRAPFEDDKLKILAELFQMPAQELIEAAQLTRGITLNSPPDDPLHREQQEAALALARSWRRLSKRQLQRIVEVAVNEESPESPGQEERCL